MNKGRIKDYEKVYIEHSTATAEEIAKELGRPLATVKKWLKTRKEPVVDSEPSPPPTPSTLAVAPVLKTKDMFVTKSASGRKFGAIMTQVAAERSDKASKATQLKTNYNNSSIHRPFSE